MIGAVRIFIALLILPLVLYSVALAGLAFFVTFDGAQCGTNPELVPFCLTLSAAGQSICLLLWRMTTEWAKRPAPRFLAAPFALPLLYVSWLIALAPRCHFTVAR